MIKANCRTSFTPKDFAFIVQTLARNSERKRAALWGLLGDSDSLDAILDDDHLLAEATRRAGFSDISSHLYFYLLTRRVLLENGLEDREVADYVACMLAKFCTSQRVHSISSQHKQNYQYLADMFADAAQAPPQEAFLIRSHLGNYSLFMTGLFPDYIFRKSTYGRKSPGFDYYEQMGRSSFHWASKQRMASKLSLVEILEVLAEGFRTVRVALNQLADQYVHLDDQGANMDKMLRQLFFGGDNRDEQFEV